MVTKLVGLVPREQAGAVSAITVILRQSGFALGIALLASVLRTLDASKPFPGINAYTVVFSVAAISALLSAIVVFTLTTPRWKAGHAGQAAASD
jgi:hypothetical protein